MKRTILLAVTVAATVVLAACAPFSQAQQEPDLQFRIALEVDSDQQFHVRLGVRNAGRGRFEGDSSFNADMEVRRLPGEELRASAHVVPLQPVEPDETVWPLDWHGQLDAGTYKLTWRAEEYGQAEETFTIVEEDGELYFRGQRLMSPADTPVPQDDHEDLVARAISDLARRLDISEEEIAVARVESVHFPDASLGVPEPGKSYAQVMVPGVIIRLRVGDELYAYHGAGERVVLVPRGPGETDQGGAEDTAPSYQTVMLSEVGLRFELPASWRRLEPESAWTPAARRDVRVGARATQLEPPMEPEAVLLPDHAQIVASQALDLGWAAGRRFELEAFGTAKEGGTLASVESVQVHVLLVVHQGQGTVGLDFYASAPDADTLEAIRPVLNHVLESATMTAAAGSILPEMGEAQTDDWQVLEDERFGFQVKMPPSWCTKEMATESPGVPEDWPLERSVALFPAAWAERFEQMDAPPDPGHPPAVPPIQLDVYVGSMEQFRRALPEPMIAEPFEINGVRAVREMDVVSAAVTLKRYVFQAPDDGEVRIVLVDNYSGFAERRQSNPELTDLIQLVVATLDWSR